MKPGQMPVVVYVEGGGDTELLRGALREAFSAYFGRTHLGNKRRPRMVASGSRQNAFDDFRTAKSQGKPALLLVDSEDAVDAQCQLPVARPDQSKPWAHLANRDSWNKPSHATESDCHLMTQCMESWLVCDWETVKRYFGQGFASKHGPKGGIEAISKADVLELLKNASKRSKTKGEYQKGRDSFKLLAEIDPAMVCAASPWAKRFVDELGRRKS